MPAVKFSQTPSCMIFTLVAANRPDVPRARSATRSSICSRPRARSHHRAPTTRAVSAPSAPARRYASKLFECSDRLHDRVLPRRDAERVQVRLARAAAPRPSRPRSGGGARSLDEAHRALVQRAGGLALGVALDPTVGGIGRVAGDPSRLQRAGVHPGAVAVAVRQEDRPIGHQPVEHVLRRRAAGEHVHRPAAAEDPRHVGVRGGVLGDQPLVVGQRARVVERALEQVEAAGHRVHVRVLEPGEQHPAAEVDHLGAGADQVGDGVVGADGDDPFALDRNRSGPPPGRVHRVHGAVREDQVGVPVRAHSPSRVEGSQHSGGAAGSAASA